ncbi:MAG: YraN family protein [Deltaproteobacteria bacterium]|nr:YraN family protein [Deltaproteobacteria bacterium]
MTGRETTGAKTRYKPRRKRDRFNGRVRVGREGEGIAAGFLERAGYTLRERNWRCSLGEIDLIAAEGEYLVFVEVKTRVAGTPYHPALNMTAPKMARLRRLGEQYLVDHPEARGLQPRFDVVTVEVTPGQNARSVVPAENPETSRKGNAATTAEGNAQSDTVVRAEEAAQDVKTEPADRSPGDEPAERVEHFINAF